MNDKEVYSRLPNSKILKILFMEILSGILYLWDGIKNRERNNGRKKSDIFHHIEKIGVLFFMKFAQQCIDMFVQNFVVDIIGENIT